MRPWALTGVLAALLVGCGGAGDPQPTTTASDDLTVYSALPAHGPQAPRARDVLDGQRLALLDVRGSVGPYTVRLRPVEDSTAKKQGWDPETTLDAAHAAVEDPSTIAFVGDFDAAATALSLPKTNERDLLQVSPATTYDGFTGGDGKAPGEPDKYQPSGKPTFGRIAFSDADQARAIAEEMLRLGCHRIAILSAPSAFDASLAELIETAAVHRGLKVSYDEQVRDSDPKTLDEAAAAVVEAATDCATFVGGPADAPGPLLRALHAADPTLRLVAPAALADDDVAREIGSASMATTIVGPPPPRRGFVAAFERRFGRTPGAWAAYGYDAMRRVLRAIADAGVRGNDRRAVIEAYLGAPAPPPRMALWRPTTDGLELERELPQA